MIILDDNGHILVNKNGYGENWESIEDAINTLKTNPPAKWPVKLASAAEVPGGGASRTASVSGKPKRRFVSFVKSLAIWLKYRI